MAAMKRGASFEGREKARVPSLEFDDEDRGGRISALLLLGMGTD